MNRIRNSVIVALFFSVALAATAHAQFTVLHSFPTTTPEWPSPQGLTVSGSVVYGLTTQGGDYSGSGVGLDGTLFRMNSDGTAFTVLHSFGGPGDDTLPHGRLLLSGSALYGVTSGTGPGGTGGAIFKINTDGSAYSLLHSFVTDSVDGWYPTGSLILSGNVLFGTTNDSGATEPGGGTVYRINTDGTGYSVLHSFPTSGTRTPPSGMLTLSGSTLYGTTSSTDTTNLGSVFRINTDGSGYSVMHTFTGGADGHVNAPDLTLSGSVLYGSASNGGTAGNGAIYKINTDGSGYGQIYSFGSAYDGGGSLGLAISGSTLYGTKAGQQDVIYRVGTDGSGFSVLHTLSDVPDGSQVVPYVTLSGSTLFGATNFGGLRQMANGDGTLYALAVPEPSALILATCGLALLAVAAVRRRASANDRLTRSGSAPCPTLRNHRREDTPALT